MRYERVCNYIANSIWSILPEKLDDILSVIAFRARGGEFSAEEIKARIGDPMPSRPMKNGAIAVLPLRGTIAHRIGSMDEASGGVSTERFGAMFRQAMADDTIGTIVIDADSPGGTCAGVPELAAELLSLRGQKKVITVANATLASAAYWICAAASDEIVATPSAIVGAIGVFTVREDLSKHLEQEGITVNLIKAGKYKFDDNPFEPLSDEARAAIQARVDDTYDMFVKAVAKGRAVTPAAVKNGFGEGRALGAVDAKAAGLVDRVATMAETLARLGGATQTVGGMMADDAVAPLRADMQDEDEPGIAPVNGVCQDGYELDETDGLCYPIDTEEAKAPASELALSMDADDDELRRRIERV